MSNVTVPSPIPEVDQFLGCVSLFCILLGTPLNLLSFFMFKKQKRTATFTVHMVIAATDTWISFNAYPLCMTMLSGKRDPLLFDNVLFQTVWGVTWEPFVYLAIYLVLVISVLRSIKLVKRLSVIKVRYVIIAIGGYAAFLVIRITIVISFFGEFTMPEDSIYPFIEMHPPLPPIDLYIAIVCLAFPFFPIVTSALISTFVLMSRQKQAVRAKTKKLKNQATVTVLIFTLVYIVCNIPILLACIWFSILLASSFKVNIFLPGSAVFLDHYIWPLCYVVLVQLNSAINPFIYLIRMTWFRAGVLELIARGRVNIPTTFMHNSVWSEEGGRKTSGPPPKMQLQGVAEGLRGSEQEARDINMSFRGRDSIVIENESVTKPIKRNSVTWSIENESATKPIGGCIPNDTVLEHETEVNEKDIHVKLNESVANNNFSVEVDSNELVAKSDDLVVEENESITESYNIDTNKNTELDVIPCDKII